MAVNSCCSWSQAKGHSDTTIQRFDYTTAISGDICEQSTSARERERERERGREKDREG